MCIRDRGKTAYWLYPCLEYALASKMSFLTSDTKGDLLRNYGSIAKNCYGFRVAVIDLRNPTKSDGFNLLHLVNKYMDLFKEHPDTLLYKAKAERYAKITAKTIITSGLENADFGQNQYFFDAAEGILTASILLVAEFCPPGERHIVSVFKIIQELMAQKLPLEKMKKFQDILLWAKLSIVILPKNTKLTTQEKCVDCHQVFVGQRGHLCQGGTET